MSRPTALLLLLSAAACASAQVNLSVVQAGVSTPAGEIVSFGSVAAGWDVSDVVFNITYTGAAPNYYLTYFQLQQGTPFSVLRADWQTLPVAIPSAGLSLTVRYRPNQVSKSDSATLQVGDAANPITVILNGQGTPGFTVLAAGQPLPAGTPVSFGSVQIGSSQTVVLTLANHTDSPLTVGAIAFQGGSFHLSGVSPAGSSVPSQASAAVPLAFSPTAAGPQQGTLTIGVATFPLTGTGLPSVSAALPAASILLAPATLASAQQGSLMVNLASQSAIAGNGVVTLAFQPAAANGEDDPAIAFADGTRSAAFTVAQGSSAGEFAAGPSVAFGAGTTAGTLTFTVTLGDHTAQTALTIPAAAVGIDAAVAARNVACAPTLLYCTAVNVELQVNGWDNTRSTSQIVFNFLNASGSSVTPGGIAVDGSTAFQSYFAASDLGGVFGLTALFPITGDANQVVAAVVQITNSVGRVSSAKITF